jgi:general secretion pathway protein G
MVERGYSLIELLVVMAILGVLASVAMPLSELVVQRERERELKRALWEIRDAIDAYRQARESGAIPLAPGESPLPPNLQALTLAYSDARPERRGATLRFLRRVPADPFADDAGSAALPPEQTWALRSYASEADRPQPGADVFDVASRSPRVGLNGVPLRQW